MSQISAYQFFLAQRDEILRHKWIESQKRGQVIGSEESLLDWVYKHREEWRKNFYSHTLPDTTQQ